MLAKELVAASTEPLILSLLAQGESYGYALIQEVKRLSGDKIEWIVKGKKGTRTKVCNYTPKSLLTIFDIETGGNPVDS